MKLIRFILLILLININYLSHSQCSNLSVNAGTNANIVTETLYEENFSGQNDKGAFGSSIDVAGCTWTVDVSNATLSNNDDYFKVVNERLEAKDVDGNCIWYSPTINISNFHNVALSLDAIESGSFENDDIFYSEYSLDGGVWTEFSVNGLLSNDFWPTTQSVSQSGLRGNNIQIRVTIRNDASNEYYRLDNIKVTGETYKADLCFGSSVTLGSSNTAVWSGIGNPAISYTWTPSSSLDDATIANPTANPTSDIIYKVVSSLNDNGNICKDSSLFHVNVTPQVAIQSNSPVCIDDTLVLTELGGDASLWNWTSNGNANILTFEDTTTKVVGMVNGEIFTVSIEDDFGCTNSASITITVNPKPTNVTSSPHGTYCSSDSPVNLSGGLPLGGYYAADNGINNNTYDPSSAGYGSAIVPVDIMYIWADANGCKDTVTAPINVQLAPEVNLYSPFLSLNPTDDDYMTVSAQTGGWSKCGSVDPTFTLDLELTNASIANNSANVTYDLDFGDGNSINNILPGVVYSNTYLGQGAYDLVVTATDNITGCVRTYEKEFFYGTNPAVSLGTPGNTTGRCAPASYGFPVEFFTIDLATGDTTINSPGTSYLKFTNDGKDDSTFVHPSPKGDLVKSVINHTFDDASCGYSFAGQDNIFSIAITATNGCGSSSASVFPITQSSPPIAKIDSTDSIFCINVPVTFVDSSRAGKFVLSSWNGIGYDYSCDTIGATAWKITPNTGFTVTAGSLGTLPLDYYDSTTYGTPEITLTFHEKNTYSIALYKSAQCGGGISSDSTDYEFKIDTLPHAEFILDKDIDCGPFSVSNNNISLSKNDYNATFDWGFSTLINGCRGSTGPTIEKVLSDSSLVNQYYQNFDGMDNYGHDGVSSNLNLVNWTMDVSAANMVDVNDWFKIRNEKLEAQDINGTAIWYSPVVDISTYNMVSLELNAEESVINYSSNTNLEGHWEMDENSGLIAGDSSGNSRNATISGATWVAGKVGSALSFDGNDEVIATGYKGISGSTARTIAAWIKTSTTGAITYWGRDLTGQKSSFRVQNDNGIGGSIRLEINNGRICGSTDLRDNQWHHVCAVLPDGATNISQVLLYVDGQLEAYSHILSNTINTGTLDDFKIGNDGLNRYFNGLIDEVRLYSRALSVEEINDLPGFNNTIANPNEIKTEFRIDGGPWTVAENNGSLTGDFNAATVSQDSVSGSILEIKISMNTVDQIFTADHIKVSGYGNYDSLNSIYNFTKAGLYTIDLTATNVCGSDLHQDTVTVQGAPIVTIDPIIDTCDTKNLFPTATIDTCFGIMSGYSWTFPGSAANETSNLEVPNMIYYDSVGVFKTYIDVTNNCGSDQDSLSFEIHDDPVIDLKPIDSICFGLSTTLSPNVTEGSPNYIYSWSSNAFISNTSSSTPNISTNSDQNVYLEVTDVNSCKAFDTIFIDVQELPIVDPGNDFESCIDDADELLVPSVLGGTWSGNGITDPNGTFTPSTAGVGVHNLNYFFRDTNTCEITVPLQATVYALPIVLTQVDTVICDLPVDVALNASPSGGNWIDSNITNNGIYSPDGTGTFKIYYDYTDVNTCYNIDSMILTVNPAQISDAGPDIQACADTGLIMLNGLPPAAGNWFGSGVSLSGDYNVINPDTVNLVYNIGAGNCFTTDTMNLLIHPLPKITLDSSFQMCLLDEDTTIQFSPTGGLLDGTGILNSSTGVFSPSTAGVGIHKLVYSYQHPITGCWNYDSLEIDVQSLPTVNYTHDSIFCLNVGHPINNTTTTVQNHYWTISNGTTSNLYSPVFNLNTVGFYDLNYIAETSAGCKDSMKTSFEVLAPPTASYSVPDSGCGPLLVDFTNNSTGKYVDYLWDLGFENHLGTDSISTDTVPSDQSYPASLYFDTTYYSSLTVTNVCGVATQNTEIISMPMPVSRFGLLSNVGDCLSGSVTLANNSYGLPDAYYWDFGDGTFGTNSDTIFDHYYAPGNGNSFFNIVMSVTNECGTDTTTETVTIAPSNLVAFFSVDTTVGCVPFTVDFNQFTVNGSNNQSWDFDDGNFSNLYSPSHTFTDSGTYQVSLAVSNACNFDTAYKTIRVNSSPNIEFNVIDDTLCAGSVFQFNNLSDNGISNNWDFGDSTYSYITNPTHIFTDSGNYRVILTGSSLTNNCEAYDSVDLVVLPYPVITATSDTSNGCIPLPVNFSSTVNSVGYYLWDFGDGNTSTVDNPTHTYTSDGYYSVNVRFEDFSGCVDSFDFDIIPHPVPSPSFIPIQLDTCVLPINYNFQNNSIGASSYNWDFGDGNNSINTLPDNSYISSGNYTIKLVASNTYGCSDSITSSIFVKPVTNAQFNAVPLDTCKLPANYSLVNNSTGSIAYIWDFGDGSTSNLPNLNHSYSSDGNYQISLITMNSFGCFDTSYVDINVLPVPSLGFNYTQLDTCSVPSNFSFQNTSTGGNSYLWDFGDGLFSPVYSPLHTFSSDGTYNVKISGSNIFGCSDSLIQPVIVNPIPVAQFTAVQLDTCVIPASYSLVNSSVGAIFNSWDLGNGASSNSTNFNFSYTSSGSYDISLLVMNQFGCLDSLTSSVNVSPVPQVSFNYAKLDSCILPSNYSFTNTSTGGNSYLWSFDTIANSIQNNPFFSFNDDGIYQVSVLATNSLGCSDSAIDYINVSPIPIANFSLDTTIGCEPFNAIFTNNSQYSNFYNWDFNDGNTGSFLNGSHVFQNSGNYTVKLVVEDVNGCKDSIFENVNVYPSPVSNYTYTATDPCYLPINVDFSNTSTGGNSFQWDFGNGQLTTFTNPSTIYDSVGIYNIQLISGNSYNCYDTLNNNFNVFYNQVPNALLNFDESICLRDTSFLYSNSLFADSLIWDLGNGVRLNGDTIAVVFDSVGQYDITLFAYNLSSGCSDTSQGNNILEILPSPIADFELNQIQSYEPLSGSIEFINNSIDADTYFWNFSDLETSIEAFPTYYYSYDYDGTYYYTLYAFSSNQCVDSLTKELYIEYKKALYVPNALYPSAANYEVSRFIPKGTGMKKYKVEIFDLFGNVIWESTALDDEGQPTESWNGQFNGVDVEPDVYVWKIEAQFKDDSFWDGQKPIEETILRKTGTLTVIR